ncbi:hypothetical protein GE09DRAFT_390151 [Coniochaeta sp. 2T2.1]|nr:hypothetical protein GE09DRAFT_390151 [Coniochaeta sp. 2T2.1]
MASANIVAADPSNSSAAILAEIYDTDRFGELYYGSNDLDDRNLGLAARYMVSLLRRHGIPFAFLGGWAMRLRGGDRSTQDIDIAVAGYVGMDYLKAVMLQEPHLCSWSHLNPSLCSHWRALGPGFSHRSGVH